MATPTAVQHVTGFTTEFITSGPDSLTDYIMQFPNSIGTGNCVLVAVTHDSGSSATESVADDSGTNTYTLVKRVNDTTDGQIGSLFVALNCSPAKKITVTFSAATVAIWGSASEFYNVATTSAQDGNNGTFGSSTTPQPGSITPGTTGDLLYNVVFTPSGTPLTAFTVGSQANITWHFLATEKVIGTAIQYGVYNSTSAINPTMTLAPSVHFISIAVALKSAAAGTAPGTGIRVAAVHHNNTTDETAGSVAFFWPTGNLGTSNLLVIAYIGSVAGGVRTVSGIADTASNTWAQAGTGAQNDSDVQIFYAANATATSTLTTTCTMSGSNTGHGGTFMAFECQGARSSPFDVVATATGNNSSGNITADTITPSTSNGLIISAIGNAFNTTTGITTSNSNFIAFRSTGQLDPTTNDENNGWAINYNPNTSSVTNVYTHDTHDAAGSGNWAAISAAFMGPSTSSTEFEDDSFNPSLNAVLVVQTEPIISVW